MLSKPSSAPKIIALSLAALGANCVPKEDSAKQSECVCADVASSISTKVAASNTEPMVLDTQNVSLQDQEKVNRHDAAQEFIEEGLKVRVTIRQNQDGRLHCYPDAACTYLITPPDVAAAAITRAGFEIDESASCTLELHPPIRNANDWSFRWQSSIQCGDTYFGRGESHTELAGYNPGHRLSYENMGKEIERGARDTLGAATYTTHPGNWVQDRAPTYSYLAERDSL
ncbi:hypothetical protein KBD59_01130 [Candidatus Gracilibacteria bacterium]|nr:hypothetical protein [Candidatus Gracilibacteria bacterium]